MSQPDTRPAHAPQSPGWYVLRCGWIVEIVRIADSWTTAHPTDFVWESDGTDEFDAAFDIIAPYDRDAEAVKRVNGLIAERMIQHARPQWAMDAAAACGIQPHTHTTLDEPIRLKPQEPQ